MAHDVIDSRDAHAGVVHDATGTGGRTQNGNVHCQPLDIFVQRRCADSEAYSVRPRPCFYDLRTSIKMQHENKQQKQSKRKQKEQNKIPLLLVLAYAVECGPVCVYEILIK